MTQELTGYGVLEIAYYTSLTEFTLGAHSLAAVEGIILEERDHVKILMQALS